MNEKNCCSKWVPTPFSCQNKEIFGPRKASENGPRYQNTGFFEQMVKWVAYDSISALLCRHKLLGAVYEKELLFKVGANTILLPKQRNIWPNKSFREWPKIPKYRFL